MNLTARQIWEARCKEIKDIAHKTTKKKFADMFGVSVQTITFWFGQFGLKAYNPQDKWDGMIDELNERASQMTAKQMAQHYEITADSMREVLRVRGITPLKDKLGVPVSDEYLAKVKELSKTMTAKQAAKSLKRPESTIRAMAKRHNIEFVKQRDKRPHKFWIGEREKIEALVKQGVPTNEIGKMYDEDAKAIRSVFTRLGIKRRELEVVAKKQPKPKQARKPRLKKQVVKKTTEIKQTKVFTLEKKPVQIIYPEGLQIQVIRNSDNGDYRNVMARPSLTSKRNMAWLN